MTTGLHRVVLVAAASALCAGAVMAAPSTTTATNRAPYDLAIRCFMANGLAARSRTKQGDAVGASVYEANARMSYGVAGVLGKTYGYSEQQTDANIKAMQASELPRMLKEPGYFKSTITACKTASLM